MRLTRIKGKRVSGFTLVEMAIVLVIIGIILAGIMKGRDIVRGSQVKQFSQGFAQKWVTIASTYYDKVGQPLCDGSADNGGVNASPNGRMDGGYYGNTDPNGSRDALLQALRDVGITPCTMIKSDLEDDASTTQCSNGYNIYERMVEGEWTGKSRIGVGFYNLSVGSANRNCVLLRNVPIDVAIGLDTLIDGQADGENGSCINIQPAATQIPVDTQTTLPASAEGTAVTPSPYPTQGGASTARLITMLLILDY